MDLRRLKYFIAIAQHKSINAASKDLLISQPSLSRQLRILEEEIGYRLCDRTRTGIALTKKGEYFHQKIAPHVRGLEEAIEQVKKKSSLQREELKVAICPTLVDVISGPLEQRIVQDLPDFSLKLTELHAGVSRKLLHDGDIDGATIYGPRSKLLDLDWGHLLAKSTMDELFVEEFVLVGPADSPIPSGHVPTVDEIAALKLAVSNRDGQFPQMHDAFEYLVRKSNGALDYVESESIRIIKNLVLHSEFYAFLPYSWIRDDVESGLLRSWELRDPAIRRHVVFCVSHMSRKKEAMAVVGKALRQILMEMAEENGWRFSSEGSGQS